MKTRYTNNPLPPYSYVSGYFPHPISDPTGHRYGMEPDPPMPMDPEAWQNSPEYLYGVDLFNFHFYWESHEAWESLWLAAGRKGECADFLKALIKIAAAAVKAREGIPAGVRRHSQRAIELLETVAVAHSKYCGIELKPLILAVKELGQSSQEYQSAQPELILPLEIQLVDD